MSSSRRANRAETELAPQIRSSGMPVLPHGVPGCQPGRMPPILLQTPDFMVLNKPPGLPVHAGPRGGASVEDWFGELSRRRAGPWLVHRLDADTAGCLGVALRPAALLEAQALFASGRAWKTYWAVVTGSPAGDAGVVEAALAKRTG